MKAVKILVLESNDSSISQIIEILKNNNNLVVLCNSADDICKFCPNLNEDGFNIDDYLDPESLNAMDYPDQNVGRSVVPDVEIGFSENEDV